tara:strand:+ start:709 stop:864 length:156 start_codon:yes stop_codon:yes gene_type:complete
MGWGILESLEMKSYNARLRARGKDEKEAKNQNWGQVTAIKLLKGMFSLYFF